MSLQAALAEGARTAPDQTWVCCDDQSWTYAQGEAITRRLARGLMALGVGPGDRVALLFGNGPELVFGYYACWRIGAIAVPLNIRFAPPELAYALGHCQARVLLGQGELCRPVMPLRPDLPHLSAVCVTGEALESATRFEALLEEDAADPVALPPVDDQQIAALLYTSGTTARPKGVIHSHATLARQADNMVDALGGEVFAITVAPAPLYHISGLMGAVLPTTWVHGALWIVRRFEPQAVLNAIARSRATISMALPLFVRMLVDHPGAASFDLSGLKVFMVGGDYVPEELRIRFQATFGLGLDEIYGMTEIFCTIQPLRLGQRRPGSIGKPMGEVRIALQAASGSPAAEGEVGEILVRSAGATLGYWNDSASTAAAMEEGWLRTGDLGRRDADGYYWFAGRSKDVIIRGGSNIAPGEVEDALCTHPAIAEACVVGAPHPDYGQTPWAYVVLRPGLAADAAELAAWAGERIAAYKVPERIMVADGLPKGMTGKTDRRALRERAAGECERSRPLAPTLAC